MNYHEHLLIFPSLEHPASTLSNGRSFPSTWLFLMVSYCKTDTCRPHTTMLSSRGMGFEYSFLHRFTQKPTSILYSALF